MQPDKSIPLCVDLDGTLIRTDLLYEALVAIAKIHSTSIPGLFRARCSGKAAFKNKVAKIITVDASLLPYRGEVIAEIEAARSQGRKIILCTASPRNFALSVADYLGLFDEIVTSDQRINLADENKAEVLVEMFGERCFDYIGNSNHDLAVFARCRFGTLVSSQRSLRARSLARNSKMRFIDVPAPSLRNWTRALRVHQWVKNLLIFIPLIADHAVGEIDRAFSAVLAFFAFSLCASATYIGNDLFDLQADRAHRTKKNRPFAAGEIPVPLGIAVSAISLAGSFLLAILLHWHFAVILSLYIVSTSAYSLLLKRQVIVDVILLAGLYTSRIIAGAAATQIEPSFWLLGFSMFMFLSLALVKRVSELKRAQGLKGLTGRGYLQDDLHVLLPLGAASGLISVHILALYMQSDVISQLYQAEGWLWLVPALVLYWITRLWMKTNRNEIDDDPVVFATKDWQSLLILALIGALFGLAIGGPALW